jgi:hypothetical protein
VFFHLTVSNREGIKKLQKGAAGAQRRAGAAGAP